MVVTMEDKSDEQTIRKRFCVLADDGSVSGWAEIVESHTRGYVVDYDFEHDVIGNKVAFGTLEGAHRFVSEKIEQARQEAARKEGRQ